MRHDLKLKQKRLWIDPYNKKPMPHTESVVLWIGKELAVVRDEINGETAELIETLMEETV